jgi:hypothetical protein
MQSNGLALIPRLRHYGGSERDEIRKRVENFRKQKERFSREREEYASSILRILRTVNPVAK